MSLHSKIRHFRRRMLMIYRRFRYGFRFVHNTAYIGDGSDIKNDIEMGEYSFINRQCIISAKVRMGRYVLVGPRVSILGNDHNINVAGTPIMFSGVPEQQVTMIEDDVWIGQGSIVLPGITIGRGAIVAAGCIVTKDVPPLEIHGGVPNRRIRNRFNSPEEVKRHIEMLEGPTVSGEFKLPRRKIHSGITNADSS